MPWLVLQICSSGICLMLYYCSISPSENFPDIANQSTDEHSTDRRLRLIAAGSGDSEAVFLAVAFYAAVYGADKTVLVRNSKYVSFRRQ